MEFQGVGKKYYGVVHVYNTTPVHVYKPITELKHILWKSVIEMKTLEI